MFNSVRPGDGSTSNQQACDLPRGLSLKCTSYITLIDSLRNVMKVAQVIDEAEAGYALCCLVPLIASFLIDPESLHFDVQAASVCAMKQARKIVYCSVELFSLLSVPLTVSYAKILAKH